MASSGKRKTTGAKRAREHKLRERRMEKQVKKAARKLASDAERDETGAPETEDEAVPGDPPDTSAPLIPRAADA